jgi:AbrB family looped-hinge helix DNA binding protein
MTCQPGILNMQDTIDHNAVIPNDDRWSRAVPAVTVSPKYQVVIPKEIREEMDIKPGQKVQMMICKGNIVLVPLRPIEELRGFLKGIDTTIERETDRL